MRTSVTALVALSAFLLVPRAALAQDPGANDPSAGTPAGTIYQIPFDTARHDAAPRPKGGGSQTRGGSPVHSENDFGSSSQVPGATPTAAANATAAPPATATAAPTSAAGTSGTGTTAGSGSAKARKQGSGSGSGSRAAKRGAATADGAGGREALIRPLAAGGPSSTRVYLLIIIAAVVAVALGAVARLAARRR